MKRRTMKDKVGKYVKLLEPIIKKEFTLPKDYVCKIKVTEPGEKYKIMSITNSGSIAYYQPQSRKILVDYDGIENSTKNYFETFKKTYKNIDHIDISWKQFERTIIVNALLHEMIHSCQYISPKVLYSSVVKSKEFGRTDVERIETPANLETARIYIKYNQELIEKFNILPYGALTTYFLITGIRYALSRNKISLSEIFNMDTIDKHWNRCIQLSIPEFKKRKITIYGYPVKNIKFRVASTDYTDAIYNVYLKEKDTVNQSQTKESLKELTKNRREWYTIERKKLKKNRKLNTAEEKKRKRSNQIMYID